MAWILGIKGAGGWHNSGVCLLSSDHDGILFSAEEERFNNEKKTSIYPVAALAYALEKAGITKDDIDYVGYPLSPRAFYDELIMACLWPIAEQNPLGMPPLKVSLETFQLLYRVEHFLAAEFPNAAIHMLDHHFCHLASAHFCSPFNDSAVLTLDGQGEYVTTTFSHVRGASVRSLKRLGFPASLGLLYTAVSRLLGFDGPNPEGKVMGLASYGEPRFMDVFREAVVVTGKMEFTVSPRYVGMDRGGSIFLTDAFQEPLGLPLSQHDGVTQQHMDVAASLQLRLEEVAIQMVADLHEATGSDNLCLSGGVALNSVMNKKLVDRTPFQGLFIQPASDDGGTPLGAALAIKHSVEGSSRPTTWRGPFLGVDYGHDELQALLDERGIAYTEPDDLLGEVAGHIADGNIIGWFQGAAELGPRALGHRSILCDPRAANTKDILNQRVKHREWFRPYAVLAERAQDYFDLDLDSPYMLLVADVRPERRSEVAGITHVDGTARVQTVTRMVDSRYYDLISRFADITGVPVLLNTSFNVRGEAIVNAPLDALECFLFTDLDYLVLGDFLVQKSENSEHWLDVEYTDYLMRRKDRYIKEFATEILRVRADMA